MTRLSVPLRVVHQSGKFSATADQWQAMLDTHAEVADVITLTECGRNSTRHALAEWAKAHHWQLWHPDTDGGSECAILSRGKQRHGRARRLTRLRLTTARKSPITDVSVRIGRIRFHVWHSPAHNGGLSRAARFARPTRVYLGALRALEKAGGRHRLVAGDWNIDLRRPEIRKRLRLPGLRWAVGVLGQAPTEGGRVIDGIQTNARIIAKGTTLAAQPGFDHRGVLVKVAA